MGLSLSNHKIKTLFSNGRIIWMLVEAVARTQRDDGYKPRFRTKREHLCHLCRSYRVISNVPNGFV
jgi:hypothetical protein